MSAETEIDQLTLEFIKSIRLVDIDVTHISIDMKLDVEDDSLPADMELNPEFNLAVDINDEQNKARFRTKMTIEFPGSADLIVELGAVYELGELHLDDLKEGVIQNFFNKVVLMTLFPYFRSEVSYLTGKAFNEPLILPILEQGDIVFN